MLKKSLFSLFLALAVLALINSSDTFAKNPGDKAEDFSISGVDGSKYTLSESLNNSKNGVIVMFWSTECPFVQPYNDRINEYVKYYTDKGFTVWAINSNSTESFETVASHAKNNGYSFPMLKDENNAVSDMLGATRTPEVYLISKDNTILYHGRISDNKTSAEQTSHDLKTAVDEVADGKEVTVKETKFFGCGIKKKS